MGAAKLDGCDSIARPFAIFWRWGQSSANSSLSAFSLFCGKIQGNLLNLGWGRRLTLVFAVEIQSLRAEFPSYRIRELVRPKQGTQGSYQGKIAPNADHTMFPPIKGDSLSAWLRTTRRPDSVSCREWTLGLWPATGKLLNNPVSGLAWRKLRTWRRVSCRALHLSFCDGGYTYVHGEARVGQDCHQIGGF